MPNRRRALFTAIDFLLTTMVASGFSRTVMGGFNVPDVAYWNFALEFAVCAIAQAVLFASAMRPARRWVFRVLYLVLCVVALAIAVASATTANPVDDVQGNFFVTVLVFSIVNALVFAFSRTHAGTVALFALGGFLSAYIQFMYLTNMLVTAVLLLVSCLALIMVRGHMEMLQKAPSQNKSLTGKAVAAMALAPLLVALLACAVVIGVIMPLNPPHAVIKIDTIYLAYEEEHVISAVTLSDDSDKTTTSSNVDKSLDARTTTDRKVDRDSDINDGAGTSNRSASNDYLSGAYSDIDLSSVAESARSLALNPSIPWGLIILAVVVAFVLLLTLPRYLVHRLRLRSIKRKPPVDQIAALYHFFLGRFRKLGIRKSESSSAVEFANEFRYRIEPYAGAQAPDSFDYLTALYVSCVYGAGQPDDLDLRAIYRLYDAFYPKVRKYQGTFRYLFCYFLL